MLENKFVLLGKGGTHGQGDSSAPVPLSLTGLWGALFVHGVTGHVALTAMNASFLC